MGGWKRLSAAAGLTFNQLYFRLYPGSLKAPQLLHFLTHLRRQVRRKVRRVWDHLGVHHSRAVQRWLASQGDNGAQEWRPAYAPELNPVEGVWGWWKKNGVPNACPATEEEPHWLARRGLRQIQPYFRNSGGEPAILRLPPGVTAWLAGPPFREWRWLQTYPLLPALDGA